MKKMRAKSKISATATKYRLDPVSLEALSISVNMSSPWLMLAKLPVRIKGKGPSEKVVKEWKIVCYPMFPDAESPKQSIHEVFLPERKEVSLYEWVRQWMSRPPYEVKQVLLVNLNMLFSGDGEKGLWILRKE